MGTWGIGSFENDAASDWWCRFSESGDASLLAAALDLGNGEYLESSDGQVGVAASEIVNGLTSGPREGLPQDVVAWCDSNRLLNVATLVGCAIRMMDTVLGDQSELNQLWAESGDDYPAWKSNVSCLRTLLSSQDSKQDKQSAERRHTLEIGAMKVRSRKATTMAGDVILIPVEVGFVPAKVLYVSAYYRGVILLGIYGFSVKAAEMPEMLPDSFARTIYTSSQLIGKGRWGRVGAEPLRQSQRGLTTRIVGNQIWTEDGPIREATKSDYAVLPQMEVCGFILVERAAADACKSSL